MQYSDEILKDVYITTLRVVAEVFPAGDPLEYLKPYLYTVCDNGSDFSNLVDTAMKKFGHGSERNGLNAYMRVLWDEMASNEMYDAEENPRPTVNNTFIVYKNGIPQKRNNPF